MGVELSSIRIVAIPRCTFTMRSFAALLACAAMASAGVIAPNGLAYSNGLAYTNGLAYNGLGYNGVYAGQTLVNHAVAAPVAVGAVAYDASELYSQLSPVAEPYVHVEVAAEPYVHVEVPAEPYIHQEPVQVAAVAP